MGRMSDLWKGQTPTITPEPGWDVVPEPTVEDMVWDAFDVCDAPFIEIGGAPKETALRLVEPPTVECEPEPVIETPKPKIQTINIDPVSPGLFTVRFRPVIAGLLPGRGFGGEMIAFHDPDHPISEQYRQLISEMAPQYGGPPRVLLFTGSTSEAGTTTVLLNVAVTLVREQNARVTIVDTNWARPSIAARLGLSEVPGLRDVIGGRAPLQWALQPTRLKGLNALVAGKDSGRPAEAGIPQVIERLRGEADWILVDAPTWESAADSVPLADCVDGMYLVIRQTDADSDESIALQQDFLESTGRLKGCVLTQR
ncbi:MAG: hypothetical protein ACJ8C4_21890 [Gemmataceae bacterium]